MVTESVGILIIGALLIAVFVRSKHYGYALAAIPVGIIPAFYLVAQTLIGILGGNFFGIPREDVFIFSNIFGLILSIAFILVYSQKIEFRTNRIIYIAVMVIYVALLCWGFVFDSLNAMYNII